MPVPVCPSEKNIITADATKKNDLVFSKRYRVQYGAL